MGARPIYDAIGHGYARHRRPDPAIVAMIEEELGDAHSVVSIGSGAGSYEPPDRRVLGVDSSAVMIAQRAAGAAPAIQAVAEALPLRSASFDAAIAVLTVHHWPDLRAGLAEMGRVARRQLVLTFDPDAHCRHWLTDYVPEIGYLSRTAPSPQVSRSLAPWRASLCARKSSVDGSQPSWRRRLSARRWRPPKEP